MTKRSYFVTVLYLFVVGAATACAQPIFFGDPITVDTVIDATNPYPVGFGAYDAGGGSPTITLLEGGEVGGTVILYDESRLIMSGGEIGQRLAVADNATFTMTGGGVAQNMPFNSDPPDMVAIGAGRINIRGGRIGNHTVAGNSINLGFIDLQDSAALHVYGTNLQLSYPVSGGGFHFTVTGLLEDGQTVNILGSRFHQAAVFVHNVPEPSSIVIAGLLPLMLRVVVRRSRRPR